MYFKKEVFLWGNISVAAEKVERIFQKGDTGGTGDVVIRRYPHITLDLNLQNWSMITN